MSLKFLELKSHTVSFNLGHVFLHLSAFLMHMETFHPYLTFSFFVAKSSREAVYYSNDNLTADVASFYPHPDICIHIYQRQELQDYTPLINPAITCQHTTQYPVYLKENVIKLN